MIELQQVTKRFGNTLAADAIDLRINQGEFCVLVGTSGCGKSTTLRMINRLIPHSSGLLTIEGQEISQLDEQQLRRRIGYAIQSTGLFPHWPVARNISLVPRLLGWSEARVTERVEELLELLNLPYAEFAHKYPSELSGGQAQRVGVARALAGDPDILLMDEPFGALDPITRETLQNELLRIQRKIHKTLVFVTHDMDEALKLASQIVVMDQGKIIQQASPAELLLNPANDFVAQLLGGEDRGLKQAGLLRVAERMLPLPGPNSLDQAPAIQLHDSLRQALSIMLWHQCQQLRVYEGDSLVGYLPLDRIIRADSHV
ncbi:L-proline glycine betaine ABC transport system permease protein ProV [Nitrincola lacisaponensis]|uniref:L-proline glycine betaine ABC transport system permease protein ProV n=1 Tax=Nitrincola lacisaponensis TaxID=267850 RepID=A0A063Y2V7_9GAMM|nr:ABC transporter ATP-binding protein [Nitrincola lacisaponensis]KDE39460.1 L-proline glycine betaine ABC transport system permease protein ProV [Nitrincola lacisaponensis]